MSASQKVSHAVSSRYAKALIGVANDQKILEKVEADLADLKAMLQDSSDLSKVLQVPSTKKSDLLNAVQAIAKEAKFQSATANFLGVLVNNKRIYALEAIIDEIQKQLSEERGEVAVQVTTAQDLTPAQLKEIEDALKKSMDAKINVQAKVEPGILGGIIVTVGSQMIDDSVARKLDRLKVAMTKQANENTDQQTQKEVV